MENNENIPRLVWERDQARASHTIKLLSRIIIVLVAVIAVIVIAFLYHLHKKDKKWLEFLEQYDFESYEVSTDGGGDANYIGRDGAISYGTDKSTKDGQEGQSEQGQDGAQAQ